MDNWRLPFLRPFLQWQSWMVQQSPSPNKRHAKSAAVKRSLVKGLPTTVLNARPVKRKDRERVSPRVEPPAKKFKTKTPLEPSMRMSARLHADGYKNKHVSANFVSLFSASTVGINFDFRHILILS
ncbi:hypothetical protein AX14_001135 [Amanita brunnescens Koide BX004]|nr:hypothetical protein AX14_001135 [Amanita brunnescens Koide BX004]